MAVSLLSLIVEHTKAELYQVALDVAETVGLPVESWEAGDPTRSLYHFLATVLQSHEGIVANYIKSGFLDHAEGDWLKILAEQVYGYEYDEATFAATTVTLTNDEFGEYLAISPGDITFKNTNTNKTYHNTTGGSLALGPGTTLDLEVEADEAGSDSSASAGEIDDLVTVMPGVTVTNATAAVGIDAESDASIRQGCRDKLGSLSPNGPRDAYAYVARNSELTGTTGITRVRTVADSDTGAVSVYLAGPSGAVSTDDSDAAEEAIVYWATPLGISPTVASATNVAVAVTYQLWIYESVGETEAAIEEAIESALESMFLARPIGGDVITNPPGFLYRSLIESTIRGAFPEHTFRVSLTVPAADVSLAISEVATLGTVTATAINLIEDP